MRCGEAREILSRIMDGQAETREARAMEHIRSCPQCLHWHEGTQKVVRALVAAKAATPAVDLSDRIMAVLPTQHPESLRPAPALTWRKLVYVMAVCWLLGVMMTAAGIGIWTYYGGSPRAAALSARAYAHAVPQLVKSAWNSTEAFLSVWLNRVVELFPGGVRGMIAFAVVDLLVLMLAVVVWRKRRALAGPISIVW